MAGWALRTSGASQRGLVAWALLSTAVLSSIFDRLKSDTLTCQSDVTSRLGLCTENGDRPERITAGGKQECAHAHVSSMLVTLDRLVTEGAKHRSRWFELAK